MKILLIIFLNTCPFVQNNALIISGPIFVLICFPKCLTETGLIWFNISKTRTIMSNISTFSRNRERGGNGLFITLVPKVYNNVFFGSTTLVGRFITLGVQTFQPLIVI